MKQIKIKPILANKESHAHYFKNNDDKTNFKIDKNETNNSEIISLFENSILTQRKVKNYLKHQNTAFVRRYILHGWLYYINNLLSGSPCILFKAILIFDMYLEKEKSIVLDKTNIKFYAGICYFISGKIEGMSVGLLNLEIVQRIILKNKFSLKMIINTELKILKKINFQLYFPSLHKFTELISEFIKINFNSKLKIDKKKFYSILNNMNEYVNFESQFAVEYIFDIYPFTLSIINFKTCLLILLKERIISKRNFIKINSILYELVLNINENTRRLDDNFSLIEIEETSILLFNLIASQFVK